MFPRRKKSSFFVIVVSKKKAPRPRESIDFFHKIYHLFHPPALQRTTEVYSGTALILTKIHYSILVFYHPYNSNASLLFIIYLTLFQRSLVTFVPDFYTKQPSTKDSPSSPPCTRRV